MDLAIQILQLVTSVVTLTAAVIEVLSKARDDVRRVKRKRNRKH